MARRQRLEDEAENRREISRTLFLPSALDRKLQELVVATGDVTVEEVVVTFIEEGLNRDFRETASLNPELI